MCMPVREIEWQFMVINTYIKIFFDMCIKSNTCNMHQHLDDSLTMDTHEGHERDSQGANKQSCILESIWNGKNACSNISLQKMNHGLTIPANQSFNFRGITGKDWITYDIGLLLLGWGWVCPINGPEVQSLPPPPLNSSEPSFLSFEKSSVSTPSRCEPSCMLKRADQSTCNLLRTNRSVLLYAKTD